MLRSLWRRLGWYLLEKTETACALIPCIVFKCGRCGSQSVVVVELSGWEAPGFECLKCGYLLAEKNVEGQLLSKQDALDLPDDGSVIAYELC